MITLSLPYPPTVNSLYANVPGKGRVKTERYKTWVQAAGWNILAARPQPLEGPFILEMILYVADAKRRDVDNTVKPVLDLLVEHRLVEDDHKCVELRVRKVKAARPYADITVKPANEERYSAS